VVARRFSLGNHHMSARGRGGITLEQVMVRRQTAWQLRCKGLPYRDIAKEMGLSYRSAFRHVEKMREWCLKNATQDYVARLLEKEEQFLELANLARTAYERSVEQGTPDGSWLDRAANYLGKAAALWQPTQATASVTVTTTTSDGDSAALARFFAGVFSQQKAPEALPAVVEVESRKLEAEPTDGK
jgi:hypothetical protein